MWTMLTLVVGTLSTAQGSVCPVDYSYYTGSACVCEEGRVFDVVSTTCEFCPAGTEIDASGQQCNACPVGFISYMGTACQACSPGMSTLGADRKVCHSCSARQYYFGNRCFDFAEYPCPKGTQRHPVRPYRCVQCPSGTASLTEEGTCERCCADQGFAEECYLSHFYRPTKDQTACILDEPVVSMERGMCQRKFFGVLCVHTAMQCLPYSPAFLDVQNSTVCTSRTYAPGPLTLMRWTSMVFITSRKCFMRLTPKKGVHGDGGFTE